ncbi:MAG: hypothetical protein ABR564_00215 [Candidatus Dormibacteria bacterium]
MKHTRTSPPSASPSELAGWFAGRLPEGLYSGPPEITTDDDEVLVVGRIDDVELPAETTDAAREAARRARIARFRQETKERRIRVAQDAERLFGRKVSWGVECGGVREHFTTLGVPVMTRLRLTERQVLDTLVEAGVARSRSDALGWCVRLVAEHQGDWIETLRTALGAVERARAGGPAPG